MFSLTFFPKDVTLAAFLQCMRSGVCVAEAKCNGYLNSAILYLRQNEIEGCDMVGPKCQDFGFHFRVHGFTPCCRQNLYKVLWLSDGKDFNFCKELLFLCVSSNPFVQEVSREWRL